MTTANKVLIGMGAGLIIGGLLGIAFAPDKGVETRRKVAEEGKKLANNLKMKMKNGKVPLEFAPEDVA
jgi:gas vesicle protein